MLNINDLKQFENERIKIETICKLYDSNMTLLNINIMIYSLECESHICYSTIYICSYFKDYEIVYHDYNNESFNEIELDFGDYETRRIEKYINDKLSSFTKRKGD